MRTIELLVCDRCGQRFAHYEVGLTYRCPLHTTTELRRIEYAPLPGGLHAATERVAARIGRFGNAYRDPEAGPYPGNEDDYLRELAAVALEAALTAEGGE